MNIPKRIVLATALLGLVVGVEGQARADIVLGFEDITLGPDGTANVFGVYRPAGSDFFLTGDFQARGPGANFAITPETEQGSGAISTSLAPFGGSPTTLTNESNLPFSLISIDLARENLFNNPSNNGIQFPVVTFTGLRSNGPPVEQTFTVNQAGLFFQTFEFNDDFTDLIAVNWTQPPFSSLPGSAGLHQFDNITVDYSTAAIPEPSSFATVGAGVLMALGYSWRKRTRAAA